MLERKEKEEVGRKSTNKQFLPDISEVYNVESLFFTEVWK